MLDLPRKAVLLHCRTGSEVEAEFVRLWWRTAETSVDGMWWSELRRMLGDRREREVDESWEWAVVADRYAANGGWCFGVQTADGRLQGVMAYSALPGTGEAPGSVNIGWIATAPWNREWLFDPPEYRGTGTKLLLYAAAHSYLLGLGGRLSLDALPTDRAIRFYEARGFVVEGPGQDGTIAMVLSGRRAWEWLVREGMVS